MREPGSWPRRTRWGLPGAAACLVLGAVGHVAAGGSLPSPAALAGIFAVLTVLCATLFGNRRIGFSTTTMVMGGTQFALHLAFHTLAAGHSTAAHRSTGHHSMAGHGLAVHGGMAPAATMDPAAMAQAGHTMSPAMTAAHALATIGTALCVVHGERLLRHLAALLTPVRPPAAPHRTPAAAVLPPLHVSPPLTPRFGVLLARSRPRRGPPGMTCA
ncbi:hypothetical protein [Streptomyces venezuelae]|uniref:hypothetical protein n=1 Tax=Streptomyces venezuelae TaxID=54571 RepID=UPI001CC2376A|nr:hypothetical protein [Streptomyces venezuelae]